MGSSCYNVDRSTPKDKQTPPQCRRQHVVPRFVIVGFAQQTTGVVWVRTMDDSVIETGPGARWFWESHLYSDAMDKTWSDYEGPAATVLASLKVGASALRQSDYWHLLMPFIAGTVARDRRLCDELMDSTWFSTTSRLNSDQQRCLVFNCMLTALMAADVRLYKPGKNIIESERGYAWRKSDRTLIIPITTRMAICVSWDEPDGPGMPARVVDIANRSRRIGSTAPMDVDDVNELIAWQSTSVLVAPVQSDLDDVTPLGDRTRFLQWLSSWMPCSSCMGWVPFYTEVGRREKACHEPDWSPWGPSDYVSETGMDIDGADMDELFRNLRECVRTWSPLWLLRPDKSGVLSNPVIPVDANRFIVDWKGLSDWRTDWAWIPYRRESDVRQY